ncbi:DMT family transporter [Streptomyces johnsoniae]|uniref:Multidrug efflux SMR transporter n=1 Tax=Streptomyces johnsoniae TaxID=3075532 RepID=A0ABU2S2I3_9ACTN|nr:multidrug efflux SMR transporter [Streptomyces sp. DSM 41886]MDT0443107.1 multidrug efflux SMR transporter [Streptomyces sp. DSM 41886]
MAWGILLAAALLELVWALALKQADGFSRLWPSVIGITVAAASFALLTIALGSLPMGTAYAVWVGIGTVGVALTGIVALGESAALPRLGFLALIVIGVIGLKALES